ncbi:hypothetical protein M885DRAFT_516606 [Pelagophyceae sp. CCMP2097]|nr:hypothetical protein M885DRAFT_516606 [Pelagophyceae sp. CCMP2097]
MAASPRVGRFLEWLGGRGASFANVGVGPSARHGGYGVFATAAISKGEEVLRIPHSALMTAPAAREVPAVRDALVRAREKRVNDNGGNLGLALWVLEEREKADASEWAPYLDMLPQNLGHLPAFWNADDLKCLDGTPLRAAADDRRLAYAADADAVGRDAESFSWADASVSSRAFAVTLHGREATRAMVPLADLLNTARHHERHVDFFDIEGCFVMKARRDVPASEELTDSYGAKANASLLLNYGVAFDRNVDADGASLDSCAVDVALVKEDARKRLRWVDGADGDAAVLRANCSAQPPCAELRFALALCRLRCADAAELDALDRRHFSWDAADFGDGRRRPHLAARQKLIALATAPSLSRGHEANAYAALETIIAAQLGQIGDAAPATAQANANAAAAQAYVDGQRSALGNVGAFAADMRRVLHGSTAETTTTAVLDRELAAVEPSWVDASRPRTLDAGRAS